MDCLVFARPWSMRPTDATEISVAERPFVCSMSKSLRVAGLEADLPRVGSIVFEDRAYTRFELLGTGMRDGGSFDLELVQRDRRDRLPLRLREGIPSVDLQLDHEEDRTHPGVRTANLLGRHVELLGEPLDRHDRLYGGCVQEDLSEFLEHWRTSEEGEDARLALIVKIAGDVYGLVDDLGSNPRRILRRERKLERAGKTRQIDPAGVRWLVRQPGRTLVERAGPRQRLLAVTREESCDTLENRVLQDMLRRSALEARLWAKDNEEHQDGHRFQQVRRYAAMVRRHARMGALVGVPSVEGTVQPNYVLQHDPRYSRMWPWYVKLRRKQQEEDNLWRWSHRTFAESVRLALAWGLDLLEQEVDWPEDAGWKRELLIRSEQHCGTLLDQRTCLTGWLLGRPNEPVGASLLTSDDLELVERGSGTRFRELGPDALACIHGLARPSTLDRALVVWSRLRFPGSGNDDLSAEDRLEIAKGVARSADGRFGCALVVEPAAPGGRAECELYGPIPVPEGRPVFVWHARIPLHLDRAREFFAEILRRALLEPLQ